jgi:hypothetical protein
MAGRARAVNRRRAAGTTRRTIRPVTEPSPSRPSPSASDETTAAEIAAVTDSRSCLLLCWAVLGVAATAFLGLCGAQLGVVGATAGAMIGVVLTTLALLA